jgi:hypothetical protein
MSRLQSKSRMNTNPFPSRTLAARLGEAVARVVVRGQDPHAVAPPLQRHGRIHHQLLGAACGCCVVVSSWIDRRYVCCCCWIEQREARGGQARGARTDSEVQVEESHLQRPLRLLLRRACRVGCGGAIATLRSRTRDGSIDRFLALCVHAQRTSTFGRWRRWRRGGGLGLRFRRGPTPPKPHFWA